MIADVLINKNIVWPITSFWDKKEHIEIEDFLKWGYFRIRKPTIQLWDLWGPPSSWGPSPGKDRDRENTRPGFRWGHIFRCNSCFFFFFWTNFGSSRDIKFLGQLLHDFGSFGPEAAILYEVPRGSHIFIIPELQKKNEKHASCLVPAVFHSWGPSGHAPAHNWGGKKKPYINLLYTPFHLIAFFSSLSFYRLSAFHHNQADLKRFMHMRQPLRNYFGLLWVLFAGNLHGGVIRGRWCLKLVFGYFLFSFCYRFVSRRFSQSVVRGTYEYLIYSYKC